MRCQLLFAGTPLGIVDLDAGDPAGGYLDPYPAYERVAPVFRRAAAAFEEAFARGDLEERLKVAAEGRAGLEALAAHFRTARERRAEAAADAARYGPHLALETEAGTPLSAERVELWDASASGERPFVLVAFGGAAALIPALPSKPPRHLGGEHEAPVA